MPRRAATSGWARVALVGSNSSPGRVWRPIWRHFKALALQSAATWLINSKPTNWFSVGRVSAAQEQHVIPLLLPCRHLPWCLWSTSRGSHAHESVTLSLARSSWSRHIMAMVLYTMMHTLAAREMNMLSCAEEVVQPHSPPWCVAAFWHLWGIDLHVYEK
jgi:hypothetical protein